MKLKTILLFAGLISAMNSFGQQAEKEVAPAAQIPCFPGAYYRKAVSSFDEWTGISGTVILGYPKVDENRLDAKTGKPLDNFSVYMGGNADGHEVDAGLTWEYTTDSTGKLSNRRNAWRPFWRAGSWNSAPNKPMFIWKPGDKLKMTVKLVAPETLRLEIQDLNYPEKRFSVDFKAPGFTTASPRQFKRVNAIDQSHNEGKPVQPTTAQVIGAKWLNTELFRGMNGTAYSMNKKRFTDMLCADAAHIVVNTINEAIGAEQIDIYGTPPTH